MNIAQAIEAMHKGSIVLDTSGGWLHKYTDGTFYTGVPDKKKWVVTGSICPNATFEIYQVPPQYVDYIEAFDAAVQGKNIRFATMPESNKFVSKIFAAIRDGGKLLYFDKPGMNFGLEITKEMLTEKKWIILNE